METLHNMSKQSVLELEPDVQSIAFSDSDRLLIFIMEGGILSTICVTGFVLNLLTLIVLILERKDFTFEQQCLAFFDMMFLALAFLTLGLPNLSQHYRQTLFLDFINPLFGLLHTFRVGSVCITVCLNIQRVFGLVFTHRSPPFLQRHLASILIVMSILYNIPKYFEFRVNEMSHVVTTDLRKNPVYISIYVFGSKFVLFELIPYITVLVCNVAIITKLKESSSFRRAHSFYQGRPSIVEVEGSSFRTKTSAQRQSSLKTTKRNQSSSNQTFRGKQRI